MTRGYHANVAREDFMMEAIRLHTRITADQRIELQLPPGTPATEAEVIVLIEPRAVSKSAASCLMAVLEKIDRSDRRRLLPEEIDRWIAEERASWD